MAIVQGKAMWASVQTPNTKFEPVYCIDLVISKKDADTIKKQGLKVKTNDDGEYYVKFKRKLFKKGGDQNKKPKVVDANRQPFAGLIGNGSIVNVQYSVYEWDNSFGSGISADLSGVQVIELVEFTGGDGEEFPVVDGFIAQPTKATPSDDLPFSDD